MDLYEKSMNTLELPAVLELLAAEAISEPGKEGARALRPERSIHKIKINLGETSAAKAMIGIKGNPSFHGVRDVGESLQRADMGGALNTTELLHIAGLLRAARTVKAYAGGDREKKTAIDYLFGALRGNKYFEEKILTSIIGENELADSASPLLSDIRRHIRAANAKVRDSLQRIISSPAYSKALQEPIITQRGDRYVVPVKAEHKNSVPGLTHDISASGATLFIEPMSTVQANNEIRELQAKEKTEIERILMELTAEAADHREDITGDFQALTALDVIFAKARLSYKLGAAEPDISESGEIALKRARHPLLPIKTAVPVDIYLGGEFDTLIITGPNTGGKTVSLKTLGLLCIMAECGLHIPADDGSRTVVLDKVLADIGDEQSIAQSLSTFSSHMTNIVEILSEAGENTLLLFDELGAGTDPVEGAALAISIIEYARGRGAFIAATTHYAELKMYAATSDGVQNASCEFDVATLRPTYRLLIGVPGKSNAFAISKRLGLHPEVIEDARGRIGRESASFEDVLAGLETERQHMERERLETRKKLREAEENRKEAEALRREMERAKGNLAERARREAEEILAQARTASDEVLRSLREMKEESAKQENWQRINDARAEIRRKLNVAEDALGDREPEMPAASSRAIKAGDTVRLIGIGTKAEVISVGAGGSLNLQAGIMKITADEKEVRLLEEESSDVTKFIERSAAQLKSTPLKPEIDLRGMMAEEAVDVMERYLDSAMMAKLDTVTVIHGKGTGALRGAVQTALKRNRQVKTFRLGRYGEGETGVTIVELK